MRIERPVEQGPEVKIQRPAPHFGPVAEIGGEHAVVNWEDLSEGNSRRTRGRGPGYRGRRAREDATSWESRKSPDQP